MRHDHAMHSARSPHIALAHRLAPVVRLTPTAAILGRGATTTFTARVIGADDGAVAWSATGGAVTVVGNSLTYAAGDTPGPFAVTARSIADSTRSATARIVVAAGPSTTTGGRAGRGAGHGDPDAPRCDEA